MKGHLPPGYPTGSYEVAFEALEGDVTFWAAGSTATSNTPITLTTPYRSSFSVHLHIGTIPSLGLASCTGSWTSTTTVTSSPTFTFCDAPSLSYLVIK